MKKKLLFFSLSFFCLFSSRAQNLDAYAYYSDGSVYFKWDCQPFQNCDGHDLTKTEVPPWVMGGGNNYRSYFFTDGNNGSVGSAPYDMISNSVIDINNNGNGPFKVCIKEGCVNPDPYPWKRSYQGMYCAQYLPQSSAGPVSLGFMHAENKYDCGSGCQGTINPILPNYYPINCPSDYYPTYAAFICGAWIPNTQATNWGQQYFPNDMGPITWPSSGYLLASGQKASLGCGVPSSIIDNGFVYVFYHDMSHYVVPFYDLDHPGDPDWLPEEGRMGGIKVVRAPLSDALNPYAYRVFYHDPSTGADSWDPSLPAGFTKENFNFFLKAPGPKATNIMQDWNYDYQRFSVAKVNGTNYFLGVGSYRDQSGWKIALHYSYDLVHWFGNRIISSVATWDQATLNYPIFLDAQGWTNTLIDASNFYIVGTKPDGPPNYNINSTVNRMHLYIPAPPPPPPPPPPPCNPGPVDYKPCPMAQPGQSSEMAALILDESNGEAPYVFPNPGRGVFRLTYTLTDHAVTQLSVLDLTGRRLQAGPALLRAPGRVTESVDLSSQAKGIYLLELLVNGGKKTFKVICE